MHVAVVVAALRCFLPRLGFRVAGWQWLVKLNVECLCPGVSDVDPVIDFVMGADHNRSLVVELLDMHWFAHTHTHTRIHN